MRPEDVGLAKTDWYWASTVVVQPGRSRSRLGLYDHSQQLQNRL